MKRPDNRPQLPFTLQVKERVVKTLLKKSSTTHWNAAVGVPYKPWWQVCARPPSRLSSRHVAWRRECMFMRTCVCVCVRGAVSAWGHPRLGLIKPAATGSPWLGWQTYRVSTQRALPHLPGSPWVAHHDTKTNAARASMKMRPALVLDSELLWCAFLVS